jgi:formate dehydrogenase iron-sulfur subunit
MKRKGLLFDTTLCYGCGDCLVACRRKNGLPEYGPHDKLDANNFTILRKENGQFIRRMCMHCELPTCATVCPVGALTKQESGAVTYDTAKCMGCRYCLVACPFEVPTFQWDEWNPQVRKCNLCADRIAQGLQPACAAACPTEATLFHDRDMLIKVAEARIREYAEKYQDRIFGLTEAGGTSVMYISSLTPESLGLPAHLADVAPSILTGRILAQVPNVVLLGSFILGSTYWLYRRREVVAAEKEQLKAQKEARRISGGHRA